MRREQFNWRVVADRLFGWGFLIIAGVLDAFAGVEPCRIQVVDKENGWPVPLVELRTTHQIRFVTDNAGVIAFDLPELMGREVWFEVLGHGGYTVKADGFGYRGVRLMPQPGGSLTVQVERTSIAKRLGRLTGGGLFAESQKLGEELSWRESGILGCDSVQNAVHKGKLFWAWGDTVLPRYPLGIFHTTSATTVATPLEFFEPPVRVAFEYFTDDQGKPRGVAKMPGSGPTWISGYVSLPARDGRERLAATYVKINPPLEAYEIGLCAWNDADAQFERLRVIWTKASGLPKPVFPDGHSAIWQDKAGARWVLFGNPLPTLRCPADFESWQDPEDWEPLTPQETLLSAADGTPVKPHSGSIAWNSYRECWVTIFVQAFGQPSVFGEVWYAEADAPTGPWGKAAKVLTHDRYTFYNPRVHPELTPPDSSVLLFEGTYTKEFSETKEATSRYDYNQMLYRLDLDDPKLAPAQGR